MKKWIKAFRLRTLPLALSCIITGSFLHSENGINWLVFSLAILTTLFLQVLSNLANDYGDFVKGTDNEDRVGPARSIQSGEISASAMKKAVIICSFLALVSGVLLLGFSFDWKFSTSFLILFLIGLIGIAAAIKYTVGKFALAYHALGDLFVLIFFGWVGVVGASYLQLQTIVKTDFLMATSIGFLAVAVLNMNNMRDVIGDAKQNKNTLVVKMGFKNAKLYHSFLIFGSLFSFISYACMKNHLLLIGLIAFVPLSIHWLRVMKVTVPADLNKELKIVSLSTFLLSLIILTVGLL